MNVGGCSMKKFLQVCISIFIGYLMAGLALQFARTAGRVEAADNKGIGNRNSLVVNTLDDELNSDGDCSLREAIEAANTNTTVDACGSGDVLTDTITFSVTGTITVTNQLEVNAGGPLLIDGGNVITTSGGGTTRG